MENPREPCRVFSRAHWCDAWPFCPLAWWWMLEKLAKALVKQMLCNPSSFAVWRVFHFGWQRCQLPCRRGWTLTRTPFFSVTGGKSDIFTSKDLKPGDDLTTGHLRQVPLAQDPVLNCLTLQQKQTCLQLGTFMTAVLGWDFNYSRI